MHGEKVVAGGAQTIPLILTWSLGNSY